MKALLLLCTAFFNLCARPQGKIFNISPDGLDSIKIGMSKSEVEKVISARLQPYVLDSLTSGHDTTLIKKAVEYYTCKYQGLNLHLTFFRFTLYRQSDFELVGIQPDSITPQIQAKAGIKIGISEKEFIKICKENGFLYSEMAMGEKVKYYAFSDNPDQRSSKMIMLGFSDGNLTSLMVINMIGD